MEKRSFILSLLGLLLISSVCLADDEKVEGEAESETPKVDEDVGKSRDGSKTDDEAIEREEEAIKLDGLNVAQMKEIRERAEKFAFQAEVSRMMKLIINSLYRNKEIFLRELISNSSDALDKIRFLSLTDKSALAATEELSIRIKADKENNVLHVTDTGIGMTKEDLVKNLGTIAKSGTSEFFQKMAEASTDQASDLIGQFGVGFYSSFLVADRVIVTSKHNDDKQYIWESDSVSFSITEDPRGDTLKRGTTVSVHLKEEARDFLEPGTIKDLVKKYSQFINFNIYLWTSKTEEVEEPVEEDTAEEKKDDAGSEDKKEDEKDEKENEKEDEDKEKDDKDDEAEVEEESEEKEKKPKTKKVEKTVWDWELVNTNKPIWTRKPKDVQDEEYNEFYKSFTKDHDEPLAKTHFVAEGEVTFRSILYVPKSAPHNMFSEYGKKMDQIKLYVRRVFITDNFEDMMPKYLSFIRGVVDSDDLPLNVSRETLQQHKLLKVIKKKLVRKALDMIKKIPKDEYMDKFWKEFSTSIKLGIMEDHSNRTRLAKLLRFYSSNSDKEMTSLAEYLERMKEKQDAIYFMAGTSRKEVENSPFVERLLKKGYEVLFLVEPVDEYCIQSLPEFEGKKFQNVAKEGLKIGEDTEAQKKKQEGLESTYEPLLKWLKDDALNLDSSMKNVFDCYAGTKKDLETDLKLLNLSYVDLVIVHFPPISSMITRSCNNWSGGCQMVRAQWKAMTEFYTEGKARAIGVSNYCPSCYQCLEAMDNLTMPMVNQVQFHLGMGTDPSGFVSYHRAKGIQLQAYSVLANSVTHHASSEIVSGNLTTSIGKAHNKSAVQVALKWVVSQGIPAVTKSSNFDHLQQDLDLFSWNFTSQEKQLLDAHSTPKGSPSFACARGEVAEVLV